MIAQFGPRYRFTVVDERLPLYDGSEGPLRPYRTYFATVEGKYIRAETDFFEGGSASTSPEQSLRAYVRHLADGFASAHGLHLIDPV